MTTKKYKFHKLTIKYPFPLLGEEELNKLAEDIKKNGQYNPITLYEDKILDGRNRYKACLIAEVEPKFVEYAGDNPTGFVLSQNLRRRHLNSAQKAEIGLIIWEEEKQKAKERQVERAKEQRVEGKTKFEQVVSETPYSSEGRSVEIAAKKIGVSSTTLKKAKKIKEIAQKSPTIAEQWEKAKQKKVSIKEVHEIAQIPNEELRKQEVKEREITKKTQKKKAKQKKDLAEGKIPGKVVYIDVDKSMIENFKNVINKAILILNTKRLGECSKDAREVCIRMMGGLYDHLSKELEKSDYKIIDKRKVIEVLPS